MVILEVKGRPHEKLQGEDFTILSNKVTYTNNGKEFGVASGSLPIIFRAKKPRYGLHVKTLNPLAKFIKFEDYNNFYKYYSKYYSEEWIDEVPDIPFDKQEVKIKEQIINLVNRIIKEKVLKKRASRKLINYDSDLLSHLVKVFAIEREINELIKIQSKLQINNEILEKQIKKLIFDQDGFIETILGQIDAYPEKIADNKFLELIIKSIHFSYLSNRGKELRLAKKILPIANMIRNKIESEDKHIFSKLKAIHYRLVFNLDLVGNQEYFELAKNLEKSLSIIDFRRDLPLKELHNYFQVLFGYGSVVNSEYIDRFIDFCNSFEGSKCTRTYIKINARQCKACHLIRNNQLDDVEKWLEEMDELLKRHERRNIEGYFNQMAHCSLIKGRYYFEKGSSFYEEAREAINISIEYFYKTYGYYQKIIERGFAFYILYKIDLYYENFLEASKNKEMALTNIQDSEKKRYCLFDTQKVIAELTTDIDFNYLN